MNKFETMEDIANRCISKKLTVIGSQTGIERIPFMVQILEQIAEQKKGKCLIHSIELSESQFRKCYPVWSAGIVIDDTLDYEKEEEWLENKIKNTPNLVAIGIADLLLVNREESLLALSEKYHIPIIVAASLSRCASDHKNGGRPWISDLPKKLLPEYRDFVLLLWREHLTERVMGGAHLLPIGDKAELYIYENNGESLYICRGKFNSNKRYNFFCNEDMICSVLSPQQLIYDAYKFVGAFEYVESQMIELIEQSVERNDISHEYGESLKEYILQFKDVIREVQMNVT